jgi:hypothetical protein
MARRFTISFRPSIEFLGLYHELTDVAANKSDRLD